ncbi:MAG: hypothetical protein Kow0029_07600 [Candidatus Rifleibacteriota bacterium]
MAILPIALTLLTLNQVLQNLEKLEISETANFLAEKSDMIAAQVHSESFLKPILNRFAHKYFELEEKDIRKLYELYKKIENEASVKLDVYVYDSNGQLIKTDLYPKQSEELFQFIWNYLNGKNSLKEYNFYKPLLQRNFGRNFSLRSFKKRRNEIVQFVCNAKYGLIYHSMKNAGKHGKNRGFLVVVRNLPSHYDILKRSLANFEMDNILLAIKTTDQELIAVENSRSKAAEAITKFEQLKTDRLVLNDYVWKKTDIADFSIFAGKPSRMAFFNNIRRFANLFALVLALLSFFVIYKLQFAKRKVWISIRLKLVVVFLFAVYLPLLGLFFTSFKGLQDRRTVLENDARKRMLDILYQLDTGFKKKEAEILEIFNNFYNNHTWQKKITADWTKTTELIRKAANVDTKGRNFFNWLEIRNNKLEQLYCTSRGASNDRIKDLNRVMALISLEKFVPEKLAPEAKKIRQSDFIIRSIIENPVLGFSHYFEVPGQLVPMEFEGAFLYWYWNYYKDPIGDVFFFASNTKAQYNAIEYLEESLQKKFAQGNVLLKLISYHPTENKWIPETFGQVDSITNLNRLCALNNRITSTRINLEGKTYLATCFPGIKMRDVFLTCLYPVDEIDAKIETMRQQIYLGIILILVMAILTGLLLTRSFLKPVSEINKGLKALHKRQTDFRLTIKTNDEFGELSETFNQMMIEVREMLLAGAVQQCLIPTKPPEIEGFDLVIFNQMATDVGGDYADAFILPDNKFLLVLGDVTGHGISSSILTAMVKALIFRYSQSPTELPVALKQLSEMIFDLLKHRKLMTFCAVLIDKITGEFELANAGHPYPVVSRSDGSTFSIEHSSLPLGVSKRRSNFPTISGKLEPGDTFVMYTDGIAEATNNQNEIFGFNRVERIISRNCQNSAEELKQNLLDEFWNHYTAENLDDDLTFVILKRNSCQKSHPFNDNYG